jgi:hypothetical protein
MIDDMPSAIGAKIEAILQYLVAAGVAKDAKSNRDRYYTAQSIFHSYTRGRDAMEIASSGMSSRIELTQVTSFSDKQLQDNNISWFADKVLYELDCDISAPKHYDSSSVDDPRSFYRDSLRRLPGLGFGTSHKHHIHTYSELIGYQLLDMGH